MSERPPAAKLVKASLTYDEAKALARDADPEIRRAIASRGDIKPEILYFLAEDPHPAVRRAIAANQAAPRQADLLLVRDADHAVRGDLAAKIARLAPGLSDDEQDRVRRMTYEALDLLAHDQITRVRQILSETLKDLADAPPELIKRLARDVELAVAGPVLEFSPALTDDDLLEIIQDSPAQGSLSAISRRTNVAEKISDAIADSGDVDAIAVLLGNPMAQIREETLDRLIDQAPSRAAWHEPLVRRPRLPKGAAARLARFVADRLVTILEKREDLDPTTLAAVKAEVSRRVAQVPDAEPAPASTPSPAATPAEDSATDLEKALAEAKRLKDVGELDPKAVGKAINTGNKEFVIAALSVLGDLPPDIVRRIIGTQSTKGMMAVAWKAGLQPALGVDLQIKLARIPPGSALKAKPDGGFPMTDDEMHWQIELFE